MELWMVFKPVVAASQYFDEEQEPGSNPDSRKNY
jgi:hypothetical protein